jgi:glycosyltransferase involved in cell wall biosynthesis
MKVAFVSQPWTVAAPVDGCDSIAIWTHRVAKRLLDANVKEIIFYGKPDSSKPKAFYSEANIHYRGIAVGVDRWLRILRILDRWGILNPKRPFFASPFYYLGYILQVAKDLQKQQCDIIHVHNFSQFLPIIRAFNPQSKIVLHMHCEWLTQLDSATIAKRLACADLIIGCSDYITQKIRDRFPQFSDRTQAVYNGVDTDYFVPPSISSESQTPNKNSYKLLFVGRISPEKGLHILLDSLPKIVKHYPQIQLIFIGPESIISKEFIISLSDEQTVAELAKFYPGSYLAFLKKKLILDLSSKVSFLGHMEQEELLKHYWDADLLINPSLSESFGMSLVEAMATETPAIATRVGGMTSAIAERQTGLLVEPNNPDALANAIIQLLSDQKLRQSMGIAGRERVMALFSWDKVAETLVGYYHNLCANHKSLSNRAVAKTL